MSLQRIAQAAVSGERHWVGLGSAVKIPAQDQKAYEIARMIMMRLAIEAPTLHKSGHPGGSLSAFTFTYEINRRRDPATDPTLRMSAGHLSLLAFAMEWMFGRNGDDARLASPQAIMETFRTPSGLPGHVEAGIGDIQFGTGPLGKGVSNALGVAFGKKYLGAKGTVDVLLADGDSQEGQVAEALRLASHLRIDNLIVHGDWNDIQLSGLPSQVVAADFAAIAAACGWTVIEVQNGNDQGQVRAALDLADTLLGKGRPIFVCYYTTMGHGVSLMEEGSNTGKQNFHGSPLSKEQAEQALAQINVPSLAELTASYEPFRSAPAKRFTAARKSRKSARLAFPLPKGYVRAVATEKGAARKDIGATHIKNLMKGDKRIVVLHADLAGSGGFDSVEKEFPDRVINVGVAEANMYMMAAGMRQAGLLPVTYTFAAFGTNEARANARLIDVNTGHVPLGVLHDCTHSGLSVGEDGETHQERNYTNIPLDHTEVWVPADSNQAAAMVERAFEIIAAGTHSIYLFSARSGHAQILKEDGSPYYDGKCKFTGSADIVTGHGDLRDRATIIACGVAVHHAIEAAKILSQGDRSVRVLNVGCIRPLDASAVIMAALETQHIVVVEDHNVEGGLATQVADVIADLSLPCTLARIGVRHYYPSATDKDLYTLAGIEAEHIADTVEDQFAYRLAGGEDAFAACVYALSERLRHSRFHGTGMAAIEKLRDEKYLIILRELWRQRAIEERDLPSNADLLKMLGDFAVDGNISPITGVAVGEQHDIGIT